MITQILLLSALVGQPMQGRMAQSNPVPYMTMHHRAPWSGREAFWSAYGEWSNAPRFGRVWVPRVWEGWRPYYYGVWVQMPSWGISWSSDEPWGDICYHYGRWVWVADIGWAWVPGYDWGPGWVYWYDGPDYYSWAPLDPDDQPSVYGGYAPEGPVVQGSIAWVTISRTSFGRGRYEYLNRAPARDVVKRVEPPRALPPRSPERKPNVIAPRQARPVTSLPPEVVRQLPQRNDPIVQPRRQEFQRQWQQKAGPGKVGPARAVTGKAESGKGGPGKSER